MYVENRSFLIKYPYLYNMWGNMNLNLFNCYLEVIYKKKPVMLLGELMIFKFLYDEYFLLIIINFIKYILFVIILFMHFYIKFIKKIFLFKIKN